MKLKRLLFQERPFAEIYVRCLSLIFLVAFMIEAVACLQAVGMIAAMSLVSHEMVLPFQNPEIVAYVSDLSTLTKITILFPEVFTLVVGVVSVIMVIASIGMHLGREWGRRLGQVGLAMILAYILYALVLHPIAMYELSVAHPGELVLEVGAGPHDAIIDYGVLSLAVTLDLAIYVSLGTHAVRRIFRKRA